MIDELVLYLRLTPEFGGTRFGPFEGIEVVLGSDGSSADITLPDSLGVLPVHVRVMRQQDNSMILAPAERTATVFLYKQGARGPAQIDTPTAVRSGDSFALVTESGPRFVIEIDELPQEIKDARDKKPSIRDKRLTGGAMAKEARRQAFTRVLVTGPGQFVQRAWTFVKSGAIFQPRYIFLALTMAGGYVWAGGLSCKGQKTVGLLESQSVKLEQCNKDLGFTENMGEAGESTFPELVAQVLQEKGGVGLALESDTALRDEVWMQAKLIHTQLRNYRWLIESRGSKANVFADWRERLLANENLDAEFVKVFPYVAADASRHDDEFIKIEDSQTDDVCARGIAHMTYRQALHLGLDSQLDALVPAAKMADYKNDKQLHEQALRVTLESAGVGDFPETFDTTVHEFTKGQGGCVYVTGDDDRDRTNKITSKLVKHLGAEANQVPFPEESEHATSARLAKYFATDIPGTDYRRSGGGPDFSQFPASTVLAGLGSKGGWALQQTALTIARSIVIPCEATLASKDIRSAAEATLGELPPVVPCLVLYRRLQIDEQ